MKEEKIIFENKEQINPNFIGLNVFLLLLFICWWYNVIGGLVFHQYFLSGEKQMAEISLYTVGSFVIPLLYTFYILGYIDFCKIKKQTLYFKLIGIAWFPSLILFAWIAYNLYDISTQDHRIYFE
ncbi:hypothetical protein [Flavobacterium aquicola]|uniref:Uncharacterized protein n=1 Tax=Flavobacterium aquicola TaxID=1682742 RepID=A0A3E0E1Y2_9FLAO|nr:hypothetical protein [Flavobacterium aquicola]REG92248.1 hypothetical protein C8P67_11593 [Flavobacterium aquicola]